MGKNSAFTICTHSYIGLAFLLKMSLEKYDPDIDFHIFIVDDIEAVEEKSENIHVLRSLKIFSDKQWYELAFKYNVTEFSTCLKPFVFQWLFANTNAEKIFYLDPDLYFFNSTSMIYDELNAHLIVLTPHFVTFPNNKIARLFEDEIRYSGIFNLGFLGLARSNKVDSMLLWWGENLVDKCFSDIYTSQFTDQKWMDFMPLYFELDEIKILKHIGCNLAPWNYFERRIVVENDIFFVSERNNFVSERTLLIFAHFSGFDYKKMLNGEIVQKNSGHTCSFDDVNILLAWYADVLGQQKEYLNSCFSIPYMYKSYSNGVPIMDFHRRLFRALLQKDIIDIQNPFDCDAFFYKTLFRKHLYTKRSPLQIETLKNDTNYVYKQLRKINKLFYFVYKIIGLEKYCNLLRFLRRFTRYENQTFLYDKDVVSWF